MRKVEKFLKFLLLFFMIFYTKIDVILDALWFRPTKVNIALL